MSESESNKEPSTGGGGGNDAGGGEAVQLGAGWRALSYVGVTPTVVTLVWRVIAHYTLSPYYLMNAAALVLWVLVRVYYDVSETFLMDDFQGLTWENHVMMTLLVSLIYKSRKTISFDHFLATAFLFCKTAIAAMLFVVSARMFAWYLLVFGVSHVFVTQPTLISDERVETLNKHTHKHNVKTARRTMVMYYTTWSQQCVHVAPIFSRLSLLHADADVTFGKIDVGRWPGVAKSARVNTAATSQQLPTLVLYEHGVEVRRLPFYDEQGRIVKAKWSNEGVQKYFDLARFNAAPVFRPQQGGGGGEKGGSGKKEKGGGTKRRKRKAA